MEIHTCKNCQMIDESLMKKVKWFELLNAENISLHFALISARKKNGDLQSKVTNLHVASVNDQNEIVKLYIQGETLKYSKTKQKSASDKKLATETHDSHKRLLSLIEQQRKIHEEQLNILLSEKEVWINESKKRYNKLEEHMTVLLEELEVCRKEIFIQKKENLADKQLFRDTVEEIKLENKKKIISIVNENMDIACEKAKIKVENVLKNKNEQLIKQDYLISTLRQQQDSLNSQIEHLIQSRQQLINQYKNKINKLLSELKKVKEKYNILDRRRFLEGQGFQADIKLIRHDLKTLSKDPDINERLIALKKKLNDIEGNIKSSYCK